ncbi:MarR family transcriptional regulator [Mangrovihabitans endophyticus]|uniref:MarR family transcriptional regulator n=1 Tax=Mangrovihabitans endophyticus TaxID=1751298 RepID=A0A8J3C8W0_9ACTN|nr:MarR family transcriptional regulator [Mangrovihabitans endophyticus]
MVDSLTRTELARWTAWKRACDVVMHEVEQQIGMAAGMSGADFAVLSRVVELGQGSLRQQELARLLGWERSRLSRQLSRMEERDLVVRTAEASARMITATEAGERLLEGARPAHAAAVRRALLDLVPEAENEQFWRIIDIISSVGRSNG